mgnify:CR=1 FL=1
MKLPPIRPQHWLIFAVVAALFFAWGAWLMRPQPAAHPLPWLAQWQSQVFTPLADESLAQPCPSALRQLGERDLPRNPV